MKHSICLGRPAVKTRYLPRRMARYAGLTHHRDRRRGIVGKGAHG